MIKLRYFSSFTFAIIIYFCAELKGEPLYPEDVPDLPGNAACQNTVKSDNASLIFDHINGKVLTLYYASQACVRRIAQATLNRPADSYEELSQVCSTLMFFGTSFIQTGFQNRSFIQPFIPKGKDRFEIPSITVENSETNAQEYELPVNHESIVWTDGVKHALFVRCVKEQQEWKLATVGGPPDEWAKKRTLEIITEMGMNASLAYDYTDCPPLEEPKDYARNAIQNIFNLTKFEVLDLLKPIFTYLNSE